ncbi:CDP-alcohol phosphatidyltransferase family protein [Rhizobium sp. EC-SD404]|uniref:CDP-alcohol phosphatidyltransferase family protein n=1 Tax=Rhizobium sp. EC-SD404 TaxID=2038389 RepID=UPI001251B683|nr:CDP-alcohol phosphatidyltransferase family protein [Rhizobium sp. EC-SD404]VVT03984.1 conserved membrane hypothetical protein [Rhizobium sp. EC-SD404]
MKKKNPGVKTAVSPELPARNLYRQTVFALVGAGVALVVANAFVSSWATLGLISAMTSLAIYATVGAIVLSRILAHHPYRVFGWPNTVTLMRTVLAALVAGYTAEISLWTLQPSPQLAWFFAGIATLAVVLDGVDGWLARRFGPRSDFGARFDMESDALLILILSVLALVLDKVGPWVLLIGGMRYLFVGASYLLPWLDSPLSPSMRRKTVCVIQGAALCLLAMPPIAGAAASSVAGFALAAIIGSFAIDIAWLFRHRGRLGGQQEGRA